MFTPSNLGLKIGTVNFVQNFNVSAASRTLRVRICAASRAPLTPECCVPASALAPARRRLPRNYISRWIYLYHFYIFKLNSKESIYSQSLKYLTQDKLKTTYSTKMIDNVPSCSLIEVCRQLWCPRPCLHGGMVQTRKPIRGRPLL